MDYNTAIVANITPPDGKELEPSEKVAVTTQIAFNCAVTEHLDTSAKAKAKPLIDAAIQAAGCIVGIALANINMDPAEVLEVTSKMLNRIMYEAISMYEETEAGKTGQVVMPGEGLN